MKYLFLLRHAKSSWADVGLMDRDRPLNQRGLRDAPRMGQWLADYPLRPEGIVSSPAVRALTTAETMAQWLGFQSTTVVTDDRIYEATTQRLLTVIQDLDEQRDRIMLVGHNPGFTALVNQLKGVQVDNIPTCGLAIIKLLGEHWSEINMVEAELVEFQYPKKLSPPK